jgi:hypothetical protein
MTDWIKAIHPTAALTSEPQALAAARISSIAMVIGAVRDAVLAWYAANAGAEATRIAVDQMTRQTETAEQIQMATDIGLTGAVVAIVLQMVLAVVHWRKPTTLLPLVFLMLVVWALGTGGLALLGILNGQGTVTQPVGLVLMTLVTMTVAALLHATAIRGAGRLAELRKLGKS